jgi:hypothetical protein
VFVLYSLILWIVGFTSAFSWDLTFAGSSPVQELVIRLNHIFRLPRHRSPGFGFTSSKHPELAKAHNWNNRSHRALATPLAQARYRALAVKRDVATLNQTQYKSAWIEHCQLHQWLSWDSIWSCFGQVILNRQYDYQIHNISSQAAQIQHGMLVQPWRLNTIKAILWARWDRKDGRQRPFW